MKEIETIQTNNMKINSFCSYCNKSFCYTGEIQDLPFCSQNCERRWYNTFFKIYIESISKSSDYLGPNLGPKGSKNLVQIGPKTGSNPPSIGGLDLGPWTLNFRSKTKYSSISKLKKEDGKNGKLF